MIVLKRIFAEYNTHEKNGPKPMLFFFKFDPTHQEMALLPFSWLARGKIGGQTAIRPEFPLSGKSRLQGAPTTAAENSSAYRVPSVAILF
jgi:hypothetical protein